MQSQLGSAKRANEVELDKGWQVMNGGNFAGEASAMLGWLLLDDDTDRAEKLFTAASNDRVATVAASGKKGLSAIAQKRSNAK